MAEKATESQLIDELSRDECIYTNNGDEDPVDDNFISALPNVPVILPLQPRRHKNDLVDILEYDERNDKNEIGLSKSSSFGNDYDGNDHYEVNDEIEDWDANAQSIDCMENMSLPLRPAKVNEDDSQATITSKDDQRFSDEEYNRPETALANHATGQEAETIESGSSGEVTGDPLRVEHFIKLVDCGRRIIIASNLFAENKALEACRMYTDILNSTCPGHPLIYLNRSLTYMIMGSWELAAADASRASNLALLATEDLHDETSSQISFNTRLYLRSSLRAFLNDAWNRDTAESIPYFGRHIGRVSCMASLHVDGCADLLDEIGYENLYMAVGVPPDRYVARAGHTHGVFTSGGPHDRWLNYLDIVERNYLEPFHTFKLAHEIYLKAQWRLALAMWHLGAGAAKAAFNNLSNLCDRLFVPSNDGEAIEFIANQRRRMDVASMGNLRMGRNGKVGGTSIVAWKCQRSELTSLADAILKDIHGWLDDQSNWALGHGLNVNMVRDEMMKFLDWQYTRSERPSGVCALAASVDTPDVLVAKLNRYIRGLEPEDMSRGIGACFSLVKGTGAIVLLATRDIHPGETIFMENGVITMSTEPNINFGALVCGNCCAEIGEEEEEEEDIKNIISQGKKDENKERTKIKQSKKSDKLNENVWGRPRGNSIVFEMAQPGSFKQEIKVDKGSESRDELQDENERNVSKEDSEQSKVDKTLSPSQILIDEFDSGNEESDSGSDQGKSNGHGPGAEGADFQKRKEWSGRAEAAQKDQTIRLCSLCKAVFCGDRCMATARDRHLIFCGSRILEWARSASLVCDEQSTIDALLPNYSERCLRNLMIVKLLVTWAIRNGFTSYTSERRVKENILNLAGLGFGDLQQHFLGKGRSVLPSLMRHNFNIDRDILHGQPKPWQLYPELRDVHRLNKSQEKRPKRGPDAILESKFFRGMITPFPHYWSFTSNIHVPLQAFKTVLGNEMLHDGAFLDTPTVATLNHAIASSMLIEKINPDDSSDYHDTDTSMDGSPGSSYRQKKKSTTRPRSPSGKNLSRDTYRAMISVLARIIPPESSNNEATPNAVLVYDAKPLTIRLVAQSPLNKPFIRRGDIIIRQKSVRRIDDRGIIDLSHD